ncbi:calpastatin isoform X3 [Trichomycterus rosablanca]|uniref:calpastatin isoform X3 n=1 Tax=Trichomycterus rosablanca TaxID=2290929 RepID=UPI002F3502FF
MGQILSWFRGSSGPNPALQDITVEEQSQPKQSTTTPAAPASSVKPAQYEKGAAKPATTTASPATTMVTAGATSTSTAPKSTSTTVAAGSVTSIGPSTVPKASPAAGKGNLGGSTKPTTQSTTTVSSSKLDPSKAPTTITPATNISASTGSKVKSEVPAKTSALVSADPLDVLADSLPAAEPVAPKAPQFTGPQVKETTLTSHDAPRCGERDDTLPPGYRKQDMEKKMPAGEPEKPKTDSKPLTMDEAVDSLSAGFVSSAPKPETKIETVAPVSANKNFAPPPPDQKKQAVSAPAGLSPAPPADKKAKMEKTFPAVQSVKPKAEEQKKTAAAGVAVKPKETPKAGDMSLDALDALGDTLPTSKPVPKTPEVKPQNIVKEKTVKSEKGVRVGERDDTLPPDYRFTEDKNNQQPPPLPKEPSMDPSEALDILSGDFTESFAAPTVQAYLPPSAPAKQQPQVEDLSALDALADDFVAPAQAKKVSSGLPPAAKSTPLPTYQSTDMSFDALDALGDTLPTAQPVPKSPEIRPEDIVDEKNLTSKKGVFVGEREDTLPPDYRFPKDDPKKHPEPPKPQPSMDPSEALDILSGDFTTPSVASAVQAPVPPSAPPANSSADFALEKLADDFLAPTSASTVKSAAPMPPKANTQLQDDTSAMDALSDTLTGIGAVPEPVPVTPKQEVKEKLVVEEKLRKAGETDDTLPPEYRPTEADKKAAAEMKLQTKAGVPDKQTSIDESKALELLSSDFSDPSPAPPASQTQTPPAKTSTTSKVPGPVLDELASTLLPNLSGKKSTDSKPKGKSGKSKSKPKKPAVADVPAVKDLPGKPSTDVVSSTTTQKGGKS